MAGNTLPNPAFAASFGGEYPRLSTPGLSEIYQAHFRYVWRCLRSLGVGEATLDDAVQEVFLVVQRKLSVFDGACDVRSWLYAIIIRVARRHRSQAARDARRFLDHQSALNSASTRQAIQPTADLRQDIEKHERLAIARRALDLLDDSKREVFVLACIEGMSAPEIGALIDVPVNTVYSRLRAARQAFAAAVTQVSEPRALEGTSDDQAT